MDRLLQYAFANNLVPPRLSIRILGDTDTNVRKSYVILTFNNRTIVRTGYNSTKEIVDAAAEEFLREI